MKDNYVAKHARKFNKAHVFKDKKKATKGGFRKHKGWFKDGDSSY